MSSKKPLFNNIILTKFIIGNLDQETTEKIEFFLTFDTDLQKRLDNCKSDYEELCNRSETEWGDVIGKNEQSNDDKIIHLSNAKKSTNSSGTIVNGNYGSFVANFFHGHMVTTIAASVMFGLLIGSQNMESLLDSSKYSPQNFGKYRSASKVENSLDDIDIAVFGEPEVVEKIVYVDKIVKVIVEKIVYQDKVVEKVVKINLNDPTVRRLKEALNKDIDFVPALDSNNAISIISEFKNTQGYQCRLAESGKEYLVACKNKHGNWLIHQPK
jgi:hypothetical protein